MIIIFSLSKVLFYTLNSGKPDCVLFWKQPDDIGHGPAGPITMKF